MGTVAPLNDTDFSDKVPWDEEELGIFLNFPHGLGLAFNEATSVNLPKWRKKEEDKAIFEAMMKESRGIRHTVTTSKRSTGWGRSQGTYRK